MKKITLLIIKFYQHYLSPATELLGARCRFHPSCSEYAFESFDKLPWWKALFRTTFRLLKCGPWHDGGIDEVKI